MIFPSTKFYLSAGVGLCAFLSVAFADEASLAQAQLAARTASPLVVFGGETVAVPLELASPAEAVLTLRGTLFQVASSVVMPVAKDIQLVTDAQVSAGAGKRVEIALPLPSVRVRTSMVLKLEARSGAAAGWQPAGQVFLRVLPVKTEVVQALRQQFAWFKERGVQPVIVGASPALRAFFKNLDVAVESVPTFAEVTADAHRLYMGEGGAGEMPSSPRQGVAVIRWTMDPFMAEGVIVTQSARSFTVGINRSTALRADDARLWADILDQLSLLQLQFQPAISP